MIAAVSPVSAPVTAIVLAHSRPETTLETVDRLQAIEPVREILVVDTGSMGIAAMADARGGKARGVRTADIGIGGRNAGAREASHELLVMLDDDSWPLPGAVERLAAALEANPGTAVAGGLVRNVDPAGDVLRVTAVPPGCRRSSSPRAAAWCGAPRSSRSEASSSRTTSPPWRWS
jgi:GT2 family glycosyltransferase